MVSFQFFETHERGDVEGKEMEAYVLYGMKVLEYEHPEKERTCEEPVDDTLGFRDEETTVVSEEEEVEQPEVFWEPARVVCEVQLQKETVLEFTEYRSYNRIELTTNGGWDQYLPNFTSTVEK
jgi:hypothetical protein